MNISQQLGESSCKRQENGDKSTEPERPLKKARFAWQVKGKYHLKTDMTDEKNSYSDVEVPTEDTPFVCSSDSEIETGSLGEHNLDMLEDYFELKKKDFNKLGPNVDSEDSKSKKEDDSKEIIPTQRYHLTFPHYMSGSDSTICTCLDTSHNEVISVPMSMVHKNMSWVEDQCINRWQYLQLTRACLDNSMNQILESWLMPMLSTQENGNRVLDIVDLIENLPRRNRVENEGILMAISAHGLQNNSDSSTDSNSILSSLQANASSSPNSPMPSESNFSSIQVDSPSPPSSPIVFDDISNRNQGKFWEDLNRTCLCTDIRNDKSITETSKIESMVTPKACPESSKTSSGDQHNNCFDFDKYRQYGNVSLYGEDLCTDQFDFMDTAVSFAIQNKGLTSYGTD